MEDIPEEPIFPQAYSPGYGKSDPGFLNKFYTAEWIFAVASLGITFGYSVSGFPPNIILACICWAITLFVVLHFIWVQTTGKSKLIRWVPILLIPMLISKSLWRSIVSEYSAQNPKVPMLSITIGTIPGLPEGVTNENLRYRICEIQNTNNVEIDNFMGRIQFPEPIVATVGTDLPPGTIIVWDPILTKFSISGMGSKSSLAANSARYYQNIPALFFPGNKGQLTGFSEGGDLTGVWQLTINKLPPKESLSIYFLTDYKGDATNYIALANAEFKTNGAAISMTARGDGKGGSILMNLTMAVIINTNHTVNPKENWQFGTNWLRFYLEGLYDYPLAGAPEQQHFLVPFSFNTNNRAVSSLPIRTDDGKWRRVMIEYQ